MSENAELTHDFGELCARLCHRYVPLAQLLLLSVYKPASNVSWSTFYVTRASPIGTANMRFEGGPRLSASNEKTKVRIFESYGWRDASSVAERLKDSLNATGDYDVWIDRDHLSADDK